MIIEEITNNEALSCGDRKGWKLSWKNDFNNKCKGIINGIFEKVQISYQT